MANQRGLALTPAASQPQALFWLALGLFALPCLCWVAGSGLALAGFRSSALSWLSCFSALSGLVLPLALVASPWFGFSSLCVSGPRGGVPPPRVGLLGAWLAWGPSLGLGWLWSAWWLPGAPLPAAPWVPGSMALYSSARTGTLLQVFWPPGAGLRPSSAPGLYRPSSKCDLHMHEHWLGDHLRSASAWRADGLASPLFQK